MSCLMAPQKLLTVRLHGTSARLLTAYECTICCTMAVSSFGVMTSHQLQSITMR